MSLLRSLAVAADIVSFRVALENLYNTSALKLVRIYSPLEDSGEDLVNIPPTHIRACVIQHH